MANGNHVTPRAAAAAMPRPLMAGMALALALLTALALVLAAAPAQARPGRNSHAVRMAKWWNAPAMAEALSLTQEEKTRLDDLFLAKSQRSIELEGRMHQARLEVDAAFDREPVDKNRAAKAFAIIEEGKAQRSRSLHQFLLAVRELLGRDRFKQLKELYRENMRPGPPKRP